jgi:hypothetical protein
MLASTFHVGIKALHTGIVFFYASVKGYHVSIKVFHTGIILFLPVLLLVYFFFLYVSIVTKQF